MTADHNRAIEAMDRLLTFGMTADSVSDEMKREIQGVYTSYFEDYKRDREGLISAIENGDELPINFNTFFTKSSAALQAAVDLSYSAASAKTQYIESRRDESVAAFFAFVALLLVVVAVCAFQLYYTQVKVTGRILTLADLMDSLSAGNTNIDLDKMQSTDELGSMAKSVEVFKQNAIAKQRLEAQSDEMADQFEKNVYGIVKRVESASEKMHHMSADLNNVITDSSRRSSSVAEASQSAASDVQTVAAAAEEMSSSLREIYGTVTETAERANVCASSANSSKTKLNDLQSAVKKSTA